MRTLTIALLFCVLQSFALSATAESIRLTIYDDGKSCPADCDAHVVFDNSLNGTEFAHSRETTKAPFSKCIVGETCLLCIESGGKQCLEATYRGGGPAHKTFDFTPAFYQKACAGQPPQDALKAKCEELRKGAKALEDRINCFAEPTRAECEALIKAARETQTADRTVYDECKAKGELNFNKDRPKEIQRSNNCAYERYGTGGPNSKGTTWKKLLPGVCRSGTFVGRDGLDCCSGNSFSDGPLGLECRAFYPAKQKS